MDTSRRSTFLAVLIAAVSALPQCAGAPPPPAASPPPASPPLASATPVPATPTVEPVSAVDLGPSWRPGCPIEPDQLRRVGVNHVSFDGQTHHGELIVREDLVPQVIAVFEQLYQLRYPIAKIRTVDHYPGAADELSMEDNNTSAFNCRAIPGTHQWSPHAYGRAIDLNPLLNPFTDGSTDGQGQFEPNNAAAYLDRRRTDPGVLHDGDPAVLAFTDRGWKWGGHWRSPIDYQHFERS